MLRLESHLSIWSPGNTPQHDNETTGFNKYKKVSNVCMFVFSRVREKKREREKKVDSCPLSSGRTSNITPRQHMTASERGLRNACDTSEWSDTKVKKGEED